MLFMNHFNYILILLSRGNINWVMMIIKQISKGLGKYIRPPLKKKRFIGWF